MRWLVNTFVSMSMFANQLDVRWQKFSPKANQLVDKATSGQNKQRNNFTGFPMKKVQEKKVFQSNQSDKVQQKKKEKKQGIKEINKKRRKKKEMEENSSC